MIVPNPYHGNLPAGSNAVPLAKPLAERVRHYLDQHPEVTRQEFLLEAITALPKQSHNDTANSGKDSDPFAFPIPRYKIGCSVERQPTSKLLCHK